MAADPAERAPEEPAQDSAQPRGRAGRALRAGFVAVAVVLCGLAVADQWTAVRGSLDRLGPAALGLAFLAVLVGHAGSMLVWRSLLADLGSPLPVPAAARIFFVSQLGKYLPGSVWPAVAQMEMGRVHGVPRRRSATGFLLTLLVVLVAGLLVAAAALPFFAYAETRRFAFAFAAAPLLLVGLHPRVLNPALDRLLRLARRPPLEHPLSGRAVFRAGGWAVAAWAVYGVHLWLLVRALEPAGAGLDAGLGAGRTLLLATGGLALAWCAGFLVVFVPAGAGVREAALVAALAPALDPGPALVAALASRLLMTVGDLLCAALAGWAARMGFSRNQVT
jgi:uncharacterized membrane protein YbhN (UPF0104 family)